MNEVLFYFAFQLYERRTKCGQMEDVLLIDRHDVFGTFAHRSYLRVRQNLGVAPLMCRSRIARILHDQPDRNYEVLARTIESIAKRKKKNPQINRFSIRNGFDN